MALFLPQRWRRQPQTVCRVSRAGIGASCTFFFYKVGGTWVDAATGITPTTETGSAFAGTYLGEPLLAGRYSNTQTIMPDHPTHNMLGEMSLAVGLRPRALTNYTHVIQKGAATGNTNCPFLFRVGSTSTDSFLLFFRANATAYRLSNTGSTRLTAGNESFIGVSAPALIESSVTMHWKDGSNVFVSQAMAMATGTGTGAATTLNEPTYLGKRNDGVTQLDGDLFYVAGFSTQLSDVGMREVATNPWALLAPLRRRVFFIGAAGPVIVVGTAKASAGGNAKAVGTGAGLGTAKASAGGNAKAVGTAATIGIAKASGGGEASAVGTAGAVSKTGTGSATGGGAARAVGAKAFSGIAAAQGGGNAKAVGGVPPPPGLVDHYIHGWPVNKDGALLVRIMP